jgi:hypothetical protein
VGALRGFLFPEQPQAHYAIYVIGIDQPWVALLASYLGAVNKKTVDPVNDKTVMSLKGYVGRKHQLIEYPFPDYH